MPSEKVISLLFLHMIAIHQFVSITWFSLKVSLLQKVILKKVFKEFISNLKLKKCENLNAYECSYLP